MKKILGGLVAYFMYFCVATVMAQGIMLLYVSTKVDLTPETIRRMAQVAYGIEEKPTETPIPADLTEPAAETHSQVVESRALALRNMELRQQSLQSLKAGIDQQRREVAEETASTERARKAFDNRLTEWSDAERTAAIDNAVAFIAGLKAPQAKEQIQLMWERGEKDWVVSLVKSLPTTNRNKIAAEFKGEDESRDLSEIIRLLREGVPEIRLAQDVERMLNDSTPR